MTPQQTVRFWAQIQKSETGCWIWTGCTNSYGYGVSRVFDKYKGSHRVAWEIANGKEIPKGLCVMHSCDVRACCNPAHLSLGTLAENAHDRHQKNRDAKGETNSNTKLSPENVRDIRIQLALGAFKTALGRQYGVSEVAIAKIEKGKSHKHVK